MRTKIIFWILFISSLSWMIISRTSVFSSDEKTPQEILKPIAVGKSLIPPSLMADVGMPLRLKIPTIKISTFIEYVSITSSGVLDAPKNPIHTGWYSSGPRPGEKGNAVIDGHYGWRNGMQAAFDNLHKLVMGDKIYVEDDQGVPVTFIVRELKRYSEDEDTKDIFLSGDGKSHLVLITCGGVWDSIKKSYPYRLVVFADRVE